MLLPAFSQAEWIETDGLGGFAMGTASGLRTRRYQGLLLTATTPPTGRVMLVSGFDAWVETASGRHAITTQNYRGDMRHPDGATRLESFDSEPWPCWRFRLDDGTVIEQDLFIPRGTSAVCLRWRRKEIHGSCQGIGAAPWAHRPRPAGPHTHRPRRAAHRSRR